MLIDHSALLFGLLRNFTGTALAASIFYSLDALWSDTLVSWWTTSTYIFPNEGQAVLPAMVLGFIIPSILTFIPFENNIMTQHSAVILMFFPLLIVLVRRKLSQSTSKWTRFSSISLLWKMSFILCVATHWSTLKFLTHNTSKSCPAIPNETTASPHLLDFVLTSGAAILWSITSLFDLQRSGRSAARSPQQIATYVAMGIVFLGPGGVVAACAWEKSWVLQDDVYDSRGKAEVAHEVKRRE